MNIFLFVCNSVKTRQPGSNTLVKCSLLNHQPTIQLQKRCQDKSDKQNLCTYFIYTKTNIHTFSSKNVS